MDWIHMDIDRAQIVWHVIRNAPKITQNGNCQLQSRNPMELLSIHETIGGMQTTNLERDKLGK